MSDTPMPATREELRDLIADARPAHFENLRVGRPFANAVLSALDKRGIPTDGLVALMRGEAVIVPRSFTPEMDAILDSDGAEAAIAASPFAAKP